MMRHFTNRYIFIFSTVMVVLVAAVLSMAATMLKPQQERNLELEKKKSILESINIPADRNNAESLYDKYVKETFVLNSAGERMQDVNAFNVELKVEQKKPLEQQSLPVFMATVDDSSRVLIIPLEGKGLWGPIYGYVSLKEDLNTVYGITFDHKGETPGLGAEINQTFFESQFIGKKIFEGEDFVSVKVLKSNEKPVEGHSVDAISGGTITSKGLERMLHDCIIKYVDYLKKNRK
ncbi:MAG: NADH:ubiquinone reductase (Na(+)-transporting) subunit C [Bacteroidales bacterium]